MSRVAKPGLEDLTAEQKRVYDEIARSAGGSVDGPFAIWLRNPRLADCANQLRNLLRFQSKLDQRLLELVVLVVARHWSARYEWFVHQRAALGAGLAPAVVEAIRTRRPPEFVRADERMAYELATELVETKRLSQPSYDRALAALGLDQLIELISAAGFYTMVAMTLDAFDVDTPNGSRPLD